jgi:hypothetical protein
VRVRMGPLELGRLRPGDFRDLTKREIDAMTAPTAQPKPRVAHDKAQAIAPRVTPGEGVRAPALRARPIGVGAPRVARRTPMMRARAGPVESARADAPRVTRRAGVSRARVEGPRRQPFGAREVQAGRPTRERNLRAAAGPAARSTRPAGPAVRGAPRVAPARPPQWRRSTKAAFGRAAPRRPRGARA